MADDLENFKTLVCEYNRASLALADELERLQAKQGTTLEIACISPTYDIWVSGLRERCISRVLKQELVVQNTECLFD